MSAAIGYAEQLDAAWPSGTMPLFDLALTTVFRARLMAARGCMGGALDLMQDVETTLERINIPQFLRVRHARVRLLLRTDRDTAGELGMAGYDQALGLDLHALAHRFRGAYLNATN